MLAAFLTAALGCVMVGGVAVGAAVVARHRAQTAADLAALAAAQRMPAGPAEACRIAQAVAAATPATLTRCDTDGLDVYVTVAVHGGTMIGRPALASARAGPP